MNGELFTHGEFFPCREFEDFLKYEKVQSCVPHFRESGQKSMVDSSDVAGSV